MFFEDVAFLSLEYTVTILYYQSTLATSAHYSYTAAAKEWPVNSLTFA